MITAMRYQPAPAALSLQGIGDGPALPEPKISVAYLTFLLLERLLDAGQLLPQVCVPLALGLEHGAAALLGAQVCKPPLLDQETAARALSD